VIVVAAAWTFGLPESPPRRLTPAPLGIDGAIAHVSAAAELPDGRVIVTDQNAPAIWTIAPSTGALTRIGSAGGGEGQYIQPGGIYRGANGSTLVLDRAQARVLVLSSAGAITRMYSIAVRGTSGGSTADVDYQKLDARDLAYFVDRQASFAARLGGPPPTTASLVRFDAATQQSTPVVADLRQPEQRVTSTDGPMTLFRRVIGSPADGWGVLPDGRVAIVRASPYRVDWVSPTGQVTRGPVMPYDPLPMTDADKQAFVASIRGQGSAGVGTAGAGSTPSSSATSGPIFAATKPPFQPDDVLVSATGRVWVLRTATAGATDVVYDVFDTTGQRVDRVTFPADHRVVGFGAFTVYVRAPASGGSATLKRYQLR
jgi:hypothetical protein